MQKLKISVNRVELNNLLIEFVKRPAWNAKIGRSWYFRQLLSRLTHLSCSKLVYFNPLGKMKRNIAILFFALLAAGPLAAQRKVSELTLVYDASVTTGSKEPKLADAFDGATKTIYIKGNMSRAEMVSAIFSSATIHDSRTGNSVVLREVSGQKLLIRMSANNWSDINKRYDSITFTNTEDTKVIAGYRCTKAVATLPDGTTFNVYYTE